MHGFFVRSHCESGALRFSHGRTSGICVARFQLTHDIRFVIMIFGLQGLPYRLKSRRTQRPRPRDGVGKMPQRTATSNQTNTVRTVASKYIGILLQLPYSHRFMLPYRSPVAELIPCSLPPGQCSPDRWTARRKFFFFFKKSDRTTQI